MRRFLQIPEYRHIALILGWMAGFLFFILTMTVLVDPYGIFGTGLVEPLVLTNRDEKLAALRFADPKPEAIILGSSRVFLMDPERVERLTGLRTYNASVSYARPEEYLAMTRLLIEQYALVPKKIIIGTNAGEWNADPVEPQTITNRELRAFLPIPPREQAVTVFRVLKERFNGQMVRDIAVALFYRARGYPGERVTFEANGMQEFDRTLPPDREKIENSVAAAARLFSGQTALSAERKRFFSEFMNTAEEHGIEVRLAILPLAPAAFPSLEATGYSAMHEELLDFLKKESRERKNLRILDASDVDAIGADPWGFNDSTHPDPRTTDIITDLLFKTASPR